MEVAKMKKSFVNKNQYGYDVMGIIIDDDSKIIEFYNPCMMPIGKHKKATKKSIREMFEIYRNCGYSVIIK
jgi:hypothetical protein